MKIETKVKKLENLIEDIRKTAKGRKKWIEEHNCPLRHDHRHLSGLLGGFGHYEWNCIFCGRRFTE